MSVWPMNLTDSNIPLGSRSVSAAIEQLEERRLLAASALNPDLFGPFAAEGGAATLDAQASRRAHRDVDLVGVYSGVWRARLVEDDGQQVVRRDVNFAITTQRNSGAISGNISVEGVGNFSFTGTISGRRVTVIIADDITGTFRGHISRDGDLIQGRLVSNDGGERIRGKLRLEREGDILRGSGFVPAFSVLPGFDNNRGFSGLSPVFNDNAGEAGFGTDSGNTLSPGFGNYGGFGNSLGTGLGGTLTGGFGNTLGPGFGPGLTPGSPTTFGPGLGNTLRPGFGNSLGSAFGDTFGSRDGFAGGIGGMSTSGVLSDNQLLTGTGGISTSGVFSSGALIGSRF